MKEITKDVSVDELYKILLAKTKKPVSKEDFLFQLMNSFLLSPSLELRFHDDTSEHHLVYVLKHSEIARALEEKRTHKGENHE